VVLLVIAIAVVVPLGVVVLVGGVEFLPLGEVSDEVVVSLHLKYPLSDLLLSLWNRRPSGTEEQQESRAPSVPPT
jgi:hypothetical protein